MEEAYMKTPQFTATCEGSISLSEKRLDLTIGIQPLPKIGKVMKKIPVLGKVLTDKGGDIEIKIAEIKGSFSSPKVKTTISKSLAKGILSIIKRTLKLPKTIGR